MAVPQVRISDLPSALSAYSDSLFVIVNYFDSGGTSVASGITSNITFSALTNQIAASTNVGAAITGGTYSSGTTTITLTNISGGTSNITGFTAPITGGTYNPSTQILQLNSSDGSLIQVSGISSTNLSVGDGVNPPVTSVSGMTFSGATIIDDGGGNITIVGFGDKYKTTSTTSITIPSSGQTVSFTGGTNLAYTIGQSVLVAYDVNNYFDAVVSSYDPNTGAFVVVATGEGVGSGTYSTWMLI